MQLAQQDQTIAGPALIAEVGTRAFLVIEAVPIATTTQRAWSMPVCEEAGFNSKSRQYLPPPAASAFKCAAVHAAPRRAWERAKAICRLLTHERTAGSGSSGGM